MDDRHLKLKDAIEVVRETVADEYIESTLELRLLDKSLTADVRENVRGEWIDCTEDGYVECPFCHSATNCDENKEELHFCFSCGADMRGES